MYLFVPVPQSVTNKDEAKLRMTPQVKISRLVSRNPLSNNIGRVKDSWDVVLPALLERIIYSVDHSPYQSEARFVIVSSPIQFDPAISSITTSIMITSSNSPF